MLGARAGDFLGRKRVFMAELTLFTAASAAIGLAASTEWLLLGRAIQGVGAAILAPSTLALLSVHFTEGPERTRALAFYAVAAGIGASLGLVLGGLVTELVSWRLGFFINLPIGLALIWGAKRHLQETPLAPGRLDLLEAFCSTMGMGALVFGLVHSAEARRANLNTVLSVKVGLALLLCFVLHEWRAPQPIHLISPPQRRSSAKVQAFVLHVAKDM